MFYDICVKKRDNPIDLNIENTIVDIVNTYGRKNEFEYIGKCHEGHDGGNITNGGRFNELWGRISL